MSDKRRNVPQKPFNNTSSIDSSVTEKLNVLLNQEPVDVEELKTFCAKGLNQQIIQSWSYYSHINDHGKFTSLTQILSKLIKNINENPTDLLEYGVSLVKDILTSYQKTLYRALSSTRASLTNPVLRLINEIIIFQNGAFLDDFVALFDFQLPVLPKLLIPTKAELANVIETKNKEHLSIRYCFIRVLINLLKYSSPLLRKDWLSNNGKIISNWLKYINVIDSEGLIQLSLNIWDEKILKEASFKKLTKLKVFNEWNLQKLIPIYYSGNEELRENLNKFILSIAVDSKYGLKFTPDDGWFLSSNSSTGTSNIVIGKKTFKTHNKLLYGLLTSLKPWDDDMQLNTTIEILSNTQELIPPYMNYLASRGLHDPKLTSYWLGQTLLLSKVIKLELPEDLTEYDGIVAPSKKIIGEFIVPSVLNANVWIKCLQSDSFLIRQLSLNLLVDSLTKLAQFVKIYESREWNEAKLELVNHIHHLVPDLANVVTCLTDSYTKNKDNKIIIITLLMVINGYTTLFNDNVTFAQAIAKPYSDTINKKEFQSIDLVLLDNFFQLQEDESTQLKWWNSNGKESSLFTSLLKIASSSNSSITLKITNLLSNLLKHTVVFNQDQVKVDPIIILIHSLSNIVPRTDEEQLTKLWKLLDESISRCVRTPFKYLDQSNELGKISPFILTLAEQWKFVDKNTSYDRVSKWFVLFLRYSIIIGEPSEYIFKLVKELEIDFDIDSYLLKDSYEGSIKTLSSDEDLSTNSTFFELITSSTLGDISSSNNVPNSDVDLVGALVRIKSIVLDSSSTLSSRKDVLSNILSKVGNYLFVHPESTERFSSKLFWDDLYLKYSGEKANFVSGILTEIFQQLSGFKNDEFASVVLSRLEVELDDEQQIVLSDSLWCLNDEDVKQIASGSEILILRSSALRILLERNLSITSNDLSSSLSYAELHGFLAEFLERNIVSIENLKELFDNIVKANALPCLKSLSANEKVLPELTTLVERENNINLTTYFVSSLNGSYSNESLTPLFQVAKTRALELIKGEDFSTLSLNQLANIFTHPSIDIANEEKDFVLEYSLTKSSNKFTSEIVELVQSIASESPLVKTWINKSVLYLTKVLAEFPNPNESFWRFLTSFKDFSTGSQLGFKSFNRANINALLEIVFTKWIRSESVLELAAVIITIGAKQLLDFGKLLQILINNEENSLLKSAGASPRVKFLTSLSIWRLFELDVTKNATSFLQEKLLGLYSGSTRPEDLLLFQVLEKIESKLNSSWIDKVYSWEFMDLLNENEEDLIGDTKLIEKKKEGFIITLSRKYVLNGLKNYNTTRYKFEPLKHKGSNLENWKIVDDLYKTIDLVTNTETSETVYDPLFLSLLILNNDELITTTTGSVDNSSNNDEESAPAQLEIKVNMKKLIESDLLSAILINLSSSDEQLFKITIQILTTILSTLKQESQVFKDRQIFELFLTKILYTFHKQTIESSSISFTPLVITLITRFIPILSNPGNNLYEKVFRWILKSPTMNPIDFPLYQEISTFNHQEKSEESEVYFKQLSWFLDGVIEGVKSKADVDFLKLKGFFEWAMNFLNNEYTSTRIKLSILRVLEKIVKTEEGLDILVSRFGLLSFIEQKLSELKTGSDSESKKDNETVESLTRLQKLINLKQLSLEAVVVGSSKKRLREWTSNDFDGFAKRVNA